MSNRMSFVHGKNSGLDGDKTTTGATCIAGSGSRWTVNGRRKLYVGDKTTRCPKCGESGVIVTGDSRQTNPQQRAVAINGSLVLCKCPSGSNHVIAGGGPPMAKASASETKTSVPANVTSRNTIRFKCAEDNGTSIPKSRYVLIFPDGRSEEGLTDTQGFTEWHYADSSDNVSLHILTD